MSSLSQVSLLKSGCAEVSSSHSQRAHSAHSGHRMAAIGPGAIVVFFKDNVL